MNQRPLLWIRGNGGSINCISSGAGLRYVPNLVHYNASKAGVVAIGKTLANELAAHGIRVNVLAPGTVNTPLVTENPAMFKLFRPACRNRRSMMHIAGVHRDDANGQALDRAYQRFQRPGVLGKR